MMIDFNKLKEPFPANQIEWRVQRSGEKNGKCWAMVLAYVTNRAIMDRLDDVVGAENWENLYEKGPDGGIMCGISVWVKESRLITKWDGADKTQVEAVKGGFSGSMKRAAVQWGIGRYLYDLPVTFADVCNNGSHSDKIKATNKWFKWNPPILPAWALPPYSSQFPKEEEVDKKGVVTPLPLGEIEDLLEETSVSQNIQALSLLWKEKIVPRFNKGITMEHQLVLTEAKDKRKAELNEAALGGPE